MKKTIEDLYRAAAWTDLLAQRQAYLALPLALRLAQDGWGYSVCDDWQYADCFKLSDEERERLLDWMSNQRDYARLCDLGMDDWDAHWQAHSDRSQLRKAG